MDEFDVVVLGAGYAGLMCAVRLAGRTRGKLRIALVNERAAFVERLRLHEGIACADPVAKPRLPDLRTFLAGTGCAFVEGTAIAIERATSAVEVETAGGRRRLSYARLVIALGSRVDTGMVPGGAEHAFALDPKGPLGQVDLRRKLASLGPLPRIVVAGGGATGIEVAAELKQLDGAEVTIVEAGRFAAFATEPVRRLLADAVARAGIEVVEGVRIMAIEATGVATTRGRIACDLCVWCGGFRGQDIVAAAGLDADRRGRIKVDPYLGALSDPHVFAAGDACLPVEWHGAPARMSAFFALATGAHVADTIARLHRGRRPRPFGFWTYGQAIAVGREAVGFATIPYDRQIGPIYRKRTAFFLRWFFVWFLVRLIAIVRRFPALPFWLGRRAFRRKAVAPYGLPPPLRHTAAADAPGGDARG